MHRQTSNKSVEMRAHHYHYTHKFSSRHQSIIKIWMQNPFTISVVITLFDSSIFLVLVDFPKSKVHDSFPFTFATYEHLNGSNFDSMAVNVHHIVNNKVARQRRYAMTFFHVSMVNLIQWMPLIIQSQWFCCCCFCFYCGFFSVEWHILATGQQIYLLFSDHTRLSILC